MCQVLGNTPQELKWTLKENTFVPALKILELWFSIPRLLPDLEMISKLEMFQAQECMNQSSM